MFMASSKRPELVPAIWRFAWCAAGQRGSVKQQYVLRDMWGRWGLPSHVLVQRGRMADLGDYG